MAGKMYLLSSQVYRRKGSAQEILQNVQPGQGQGPGLVNDTLNPCRWTCRLANTQSPLRVVTILHRGASDLQSRLLASTISFHFPSL